MHNRISYQQEAINNEDAFLAHPHFVFRGIISFSDGGVPSLLR